MERRNSQLRSFASPGLWTIDVQDDIFYSKCSIQQFLGA